MTMKLFAVPTIAILILGFSASVEADTITKPYTFTGGTTAIAEEVNANFDTAYDQINKYGSIIEADEINGNIGIGAAPALSNHQLQIVGDNERAGIHLTTYKGDGTNFTRIIGSLARGSLSNPSPPLNQDTLFWFGANGYTSTFGTNSQSASIVFRATEDFDPGRGTEMIFTTTPNGGGLSAMKERMIITNNGYVGIGTTVPDGKVEIAGDYVDDGKPTTLFITGYRDDSLTGPPNIKGRKARGTSSIPTATQAGDYLFKLQAIGYGETGWRTKSNGMSAGAAIRFFATENYTDNANGNGINFWTTPNGSVDEVERMRLDQNGNFGIGTSTPQSALQVVGYTQLDLTAGAPSSTDCDDPSEYGRMKVDASAELLYICVGSGWLAK